jgi:hypothetical protein
VLEKVWNRKVLRDVRELLLALQIKDEVGWIMNEKTEQSHKIVPALVPALGCDCLGATELGSGP